MELLAAPHWRCLEFVSDLHLQCSDQPTFDAWRRYLQHTRADAVFILGDLFEVWVGDDAVAAGTGFERDCVALLARAAQRLDLFIMRGNRDFLMGAALMRDCAATALDDPSVLQLGQRRLLLSHGDALCLDDHDYQRFRAQVRSPSWQHNFLAQDLGQRLEIARNLRQQSEQHKRAATRYADVDTGAACAALQAHQAQLLVHGHTHRPARHALGPHYERLVLSDWDLGAHPPRAEVLRLRLGPDGVVQTLERIPAAMAATPLAAIAPG